MDNTNSTEMLASKDSEDSSDGMISEDSDFDVEEEEEDYGDIDNFKDEEDDYNSTDSDSSDKPKDINAWKEIIMKISKSKDGTSQNEDLDENSSNESDSDSRNQDVNSDESNEEDSGDDLNLDRDDIEKLLDEGIDFDKVKSDATTMSNPNIRTREVLEKLKTNHFEMLPQDWIELVHRTGVPVYLHRPSRVVLLSRPYVLGNQDFKQHKVPVSAIPCLAYRKQLEELHEKEKNKVQIQDDDIESAILTSAKVESVDENTEKNALTPEDIITYCKKRFPTKQVHVKRKAEQTASENKSHRPSLPPGSILISIPVYDNATKTMKTRNWPLNPNGKTPVCVLHEYLQQALKKGPTYEYKEITNSETPYQATLKINNVVYGVGLSTSKKQAKLEAARSTLEILIPKLKNFDFQTGSKAPGNSKHINDKYSIFDTLKITDPRVAECCAKSTEPSPYTMLLTCLERNYGIGENMQVSYKSSHTKHNRILFFMKAGKYTASVPCKNKKEGKQLASQQILQELHPSIQCWGSLLRLYGNASTNNARKKKVREQEITRLQSKALINQPNWDILNKLNAELDRKAQEKQIFQTRGSFQLLHHIDLPMTNICDNNFTE
uniref:Microprocessor complex subunit DGCR8 n=1 Tax=Cacopsylla melanoneura TaxID=428564 RepID=A0A8D8YNJ5_9HEMI